MFPFPSHLSMHCPHGSYLLKGFGTWENISSSFPLGNDSVDMDRSVLVERILEITCVFFSALRFPVSHTAYMPNVRNLAASGAGVHRISSVHHEQYMATLFPTHICLRPIYFWVWNGFILHKISNTIQGHYVSFPITFASFIVLFELHSFTIAHRLIWNIFMLTFAIAVMTSPSFS